MQTGAYRTEVEQRLEIKKSNRPADVGYKAWTIRSALTPAGRVFDFASERMGWAGTILYGAHCSGASVRGSSSASGASSRAPS